MALLVFLAVAAPARLVAARLLLRDDRPRLGLFAPLGGLAVPGRPAGELLDLVLVGLSAAPAAGQPLLADGHLLDAEHEARHVVVDRLDHQPEELGGLPLVLQLRILLREAPHPDDVAE